MFFSLVASDRRTCWRAVGEYAGPPRASAFVAYAKARAIDHMEERAFMCYMGDLMSKLFTDFPAEYRFSSIIGFLPPEEEIDVDATIDYVSRMAGAE